MVRYNSPGVYVIEKDISDYAPTVDSSVVGLVGFASKGPTNKATLITTPQQLIDTFGEPSESITGQALEGAIEILEATNQIYMIRAASSNAVEASSYVPLGSCPAIGFGASGFGVTRDLYLKLQIYDSNGVAQFDSMKEITIPSGTIDAGASGANQANALKTVIGGSLDSDLYGIYYEGASDNSVGYLASKWAGSGASIYIQTASGTNFATQGISAIYALDPVVGDIATGTLYSSLRVWGTTFHTKTDSTSSLEYFVESLYPGAGYNLGTNEDGTTSGVSIEIDSLGGPYVDLTVNNDGVQAESYKVSFVDKANFIEDVIEDDLVNTTSDYILGSITFSGTAVTPTKLTYFPAKVRTLGNSVVAGQTRVATQDGSLGSVLAASASTSFNTRFVKLVDGVYGLANGTNGIPSTDSGIATVLIGENTGSSKTGMQVLDDDTLGLSIAAVPGITLQNVQNALITLAETSQEFLAVVSPPFGLSRAQQAIDWSNGQSATRTAAVNNSWGAIYWPWVKVFSVFDGTDRWYDPAIFAIRQMCYTDDIADPWVAPAGFRRGRLTKPTELEVPLSQGDRDSMYSGGNVLNPIVNFPQQGIVIFGQRTAARTPTALDRVNVRRLMIQVRKVILQATRQYIFEPNDEFLWAQIQTTLDPFLDEIKRRRGLEEFAVVCDETTNTAARRDRNELWCKVILKPTKTAEILIFELNLTNQSAQIGSSTQA